MDIIYHFQISSFLSLEPLRYYFVVNNQYVLNKLRLILFPLMHKVTRPPIACSFLPPITQFWWELRSLAAAVVVTGDIGGASEGASVNEDERVGAPTDTPS